jgi:hypothetical protein
MTELKNIDTKYPINMGAPAPKIICDDNNLTLLFYVDLFDLSKTTDKIKERDIFNDSGVATLTFKFFRIYKFGVPNDDLIIAHPYYKLGLKPYSFYLVEDSDWIKDIKRIEKHHPYFNEKKYNDLNHYIITFKDNTFECIAKGFSIEYSSNPIKKQLSDTIGNLN